MTVIIIRVGKRTTISAFVDVLGINNTGPAYLIKNEIKAERMSNFTKNKT
jgi:hypothetical protein